MKRMIPYEEYLKLLNDNTSLKERVTALEAKNFYTISIEDNKLIIASDSEEEVEGE